MVFLILFQSPIRRELKTMKLIPRFFIGVLCGSTALADPTSRFGMNTSRSEHAATWSEAGFGWVRFENMKWAMMSPAPGEFRYDGSVRPWHVKLDAIMETYHTQGLEVLPYIFMVPEHASTAGPDLKKKRLSWAPNDPGP